MKKITKPKSKSKCKYWYRIEIDCCVLCGSESKYRYRVYDEKEKGMYVKDTACCRHFM